MAQLIPHHTQSLKEGQVLQSLTNKKVLGTFKHLRFRKKVLQSLKKKKKVLENFTDLKEKGTGKFEKRKKGTEKF